MDLNYVEHKAAHRTNALEVSMNGNVFACSSALYFMGLLFEGCFIQWIWFPEYPSTDRAYILKSNNLSTRLLVDAFFVRWIGKIS